jgi:hypothetical protein
VLAASNGARVGWHVSFFVDAADQAIASGATRQQMQWLSLGATLVLGVLGLTGWVALDARQSALDHAVQTSENLVAAMSHDIERNIESLDLSLHAVIDGLRFAEITSVSPELRNSILFDRSALPASGEVRVCNHIDDSGIGPDV